MNDKISERIGQFLKQRGSEGADIHEIAEELGLWQNEIATDLKELIQREEIIKKGKKYFECLKKVSNQEKEQPTGQEAFRSIVGYDGSISVQIQMAKAAISYPPNGLHMLILGGTGVGKTTLAYEIWRYAMIEKGRKLPFVSLNCAEYADNPQLLLSQLFGHEKGAFTGAFEEKEGLVDRADGGILFLDEIHRLTAIGQEILFTIIDHGEFRRLGGIKTKKVQLLIIGATTENPESTLLNTFKRRIPVMLQLPLLKERPIGERFDLVSNFFTQEADKTGIPIKVSKRMMEYLVMYEGNSNIGDLKNEVLLNCAYSYLNTDGDKDKQSQKMLIINDRISSRSAHKSDIKPEFFQFLENILPEEGLRFEPNMEQKISFNHLDNKWNPVVYNYDTDLDKYSLKEAREYLFNKVSPDVYDMANRLIILATKEFNEFYTKNIMNSLAFLLQQVKSFALVGRGFIGQNYNVEKKKYEKERQFVENHLRDIETLLETQLTDAEIISISFLLGQRTVELEAGIGLVIAAYGSQVATSKAEFVRCLMPNAVIIALDYPLGEDSQKFRIQLLESLHRADTGYGVILCTDIAAVISDKNELISSEEVNYRVVPSVNTVLLMEIAKEIGLADMPIEKIVDRVSTNFGNYVRKLFEKDISENIRKDSPIPERRSVIITYCITGTGSARIARELLMKNQEISTIATIIPLGIMSDLKAVRERFGNRLKLIIGFLNPHLKGVPFIGLDSVFDEEGMKRILLHIQSWESDDCFAQENDNRTIESKLEIIDKNIQNFTPSLEPIGVAKAAHEILSQILSCYKEPLESDFTVRIYIHVIAMLERLANMEVQDIAEESMKSLKNYNQFFQWLSSVLNESCRELGLQLHKSEVYYLMLVLPNPDTGLPFII